ncbi:pyrrolidone-carboxylate peptidase [Dongia sp.]|uniref:pyroglutamyl-peptidase I family protein n=1 Tax=Dongia sp. TaxID=1977262 RepID=UPI0037518247
MASVLITGFEPYAGLASNPSAEIAAALDGMEISGCKIVGRLLPVDFARYHDRLKALLDEVAPALYIGFGLAMGEDMIRIERFGVNLADFDIPDNAGASPRGRAIEPEGPDARASTLPSAAIRAALLEAGIPARFSNSAGSYLCNATLYSALGLCAARGTPCGFIHLPYASEQVAALLREGNGPLNGESAAPSLPIEMMVAAAEIVLQVSAAGLPTA